jgi:hypothetical protein
MTFWPSRGGLFILSKPIQIARGDLTSMTEPTDGRVLKTPSGNVHLAGKIWRTVSEPTPLNTFQFKENAVAVKALYTESGVNLPSTCDLALMIADTIKSSDVFDDGEARAAGGASLPAMQVYRTMQLDRTANALLSLRGTSNLHKYLRDICSGSLDPFDRKPSRAKDILWEVELHAELKRKSIKVRLEEPPDLVVDTGDTSIGIACKKIYSDKNLEKVLSNGVAQIEQASRYGIVALNLDDLREPNTMRAAPTLAGILDILAVENAEFLKKHQRYLKKYLTSKRVLGALVSAGGLSCVQEKIPFIVTPRQFMLWSYPELSADEVRPLRSFEDQINKQ